jgi:hypothetical protein
VLDPERGGRRPVDPDGLLSEFEAAMATALERFDGVDRTGNDIDSLMAAQERIPPGDVRNAFARPTPSAGT